ncbi:MAG: hypothetical protein RR782_07595 [Clostridium sp.]
MNITVHEFQKEYTSITSKTAIGSKEYDLAMIAIHCAEGDIGFKVKRINKPTRKGTKVTFIPIKDEVDFNKYLAKVNELIKVYNEKYGENIKAVRAQ